MLGVLSSKLNPTCWEFSVIMQYLYYDYYVFIAKYSVFTTMVKTWLYHGCLYHGMAIDVYVIDVKNVQIKIKNR